MKCIITAILKRTFDIDKKYLRNQSPKQMTFRAFSRVSLLMMHPRLCVNVGKNWSRKKRRKINKESVKKSSFWQTNNNNLVENAGIILISSFSLFIWFHFYWNFHSLTLIHGIFIISSRKWVWVLLRIQWVFIIFRVFFHSNPLKFKFLWFWYGN